MSDTHKSTPRSVAFRAEREEQWRRLEGLVDRVHRKGLSTLDAKELHVLPLLYRAALSSLSVARRTALDRSLITYLEALSARAYLAVYGSRRSTRGALRRLFLESFPQQVRALWAELGMSAGLVFLGVGVAMALMAFDPAWYHAFVDPALSSGRDPGTKTEDLRAALYSGGDSLTSFASYLFTRNARIGMVAFALGFAGGAPTALLLFSNGLMLGAFISLYAQRGLLVPLLGWLLPHGVPEIGAVILCGAAGLHLGRALVLPGRRSVRDAMAKAGRSAAVVVLGSIVLFAIAGVIEGVFRQVVQNDVLRFAMAAFNATWLSIWLVLGGRSAGPKAGSR